MKVVLIGGGSEYGLACARALANSQHLVSLWLWPADASEEERAEIHAMAKRHHLPVMGTGDVNGADTQVILTNLDPDVIIVAPDWEGPVHRATTDLAQVAFLTLCTGDDCVAVRKDGKTFGWRSIGEGGVGDALGALLVDAMEWLGVGDG